MAVQTLEPIRHLYNGKGGAAQMFTAKATGSTHVDGDLLVRTNNSVAACTGESPSSIFGVAVTAAANSVPGQTAGLQPVILVNSNEDFEINAFHSTASSATVADADVDDIKSYGLSFQTVSGVSAWTMNLGDTSNTRVQLIERLDAAADTYPRCRVRFKGGNQTSYLVAE